MATINDFGIPGIGTGVLQPKLRHKWRVIFNNIGGLTSSNDMSMQAISVSRPNLSFEEVELNRYNTKAFVAGKHSWEPCQITLEDDVTSRASQIIQAQLQRQQWLIGVDGPWLTSSPEGSKYKFSTQIDMMDGGDMVLESWMLEGCWIKESNYTELEYASSNEAVKIELQIRFDHAYQKIMAYGDGPGIATGGKSPN